VQLNDSLLPMADSTDLYKSKQFTEVRNRLEDEGYILLRGIIPPSTIAAAQHKLHSFLLSNDAGQLINNRILINTKQTYTKGFTIDAESGGIAEGYEAQDITGSTEELGNSEELASVYHGPELHNMYNNIFNNGNTQALNNSIQSSIDGNNHLTPFCSLLCLSCALCFD
jgi:hypothetical protein